MNKEINETEKNCQNCGYYEIHYIKRKNRIFSTGCGHCSNKLRRNKKIILCDFYEEKKDNSEETYVSIKEVLETMSKRLEHIVLILNSEED